jgi:hypothetical protein
VGGTLKLMCSATHQRSLFFPILAHMGAVCAQDIGAALQVYNVRIVKPDHLGRASDAAGQAGAAGSAGK